MDANYAGSTTSQPPVAAIPPLNTLETVPPYVIPTSSSVFTAASGTSNLRRMRKKELLRQYCSQDMNMEDAPIPSGQSVPPTPPINRTIITIPKAVASMTTIPTREDYKAVVDANMEKKRRKESGRELRGLELPEDPLSTVGSLAERRRSVGSTGSGGDLSSPVKRRGRPPKGTVIGPTAPKLKIKLNLSESEAVSIEDKRLRIRPPKKRLTPAMPKPTVEELKRESMKFRKKVMADFDEEKKIKKTKKSSGSSKKRRRQEEAHEVCIIPSDEQAAPTKLIIRFGKKPPSVESSMSLPSVSEGTSGIASPSRVPPPIDDPGEPPPEPSSSPFSSPSVETQSASAIVSVTDPPDELLDVRTSKVTPIRLKISRCQEGYVMKTPPTDPVPSTNDEPSSSAVPINQQGCQVR